MRHRWWRRLRATLPGLSGCRCRNKGMLGRSWSALVQTGEPPNRHTNLRGLENTSGQAKKCRCRWVRGPGLCLPGARRARRHRHFISVTVVRPCPGGRRPPSKFDDNYGDEMPEPPCPPGPMETHARATDPPAPAFPARWSPAGPSSKQGKNAHANRNPPV